jgi:hypothetical protein
MNYAQVLASIQAALTQRPVGTLIDDTAHEAAEKNILDFAKAIADSLTRMNSPFCGQLHPELALAIKPIAFREIDPGGLYYINEVVAGRLLENGKYLYKITIMNAVSPTSDGMSDIPWMEYIFQSTSVFTGLKRHVMVESDGSGAFGTIVIDWSALVAGNQYICQNYLEGCLFGIELLSYWAVITDSDLVIAPIPIIEISGDVTVNGAKKQYLVRTDSVEITVDPVANVLGEFEIKNNSTTDTLIKTTGSELIDGLSAILLESKKSIRISPNVTKFEVFGSYIIP